MNSAQTPKTVRQSYTRISKRFLVSSRGQAASTCVHAVYVHEERGLLCIRPVIHRLRLKIHLCVLEAELRRGRRRRRRRRKKKKEEEKKKKKKQYDDGMPRPVQRPGCLRLPVIPMYRILLLLQYAVVFEIMAALSPNPTSLSSYAERNKERTTTSSAMICGAVWSIFVRHRSILYIPFFAEDRDGESSAD